MSTAPTALLDAGSETCPDRLLPGPVPRWTSRPRGGPWVEEAASAAGLTGHGGGHFPAVRKWRTFAGHSGPVTLVANGAESEWLSAKDEVLLELHPHLVLDGAALVAETVGAVRTVVWLHESAGRARHAVARACRERSSSVGTEPPVTLMAGPSTYLSGESTAIRNALDGGSVVPQFRAVEGGRSGSGTLVHNVETLARLALLARAVSEGRRRADERAIGRRLLTVMTPEHQRVVVEASTSASLAATVHAAVGRQPGPASVVLLGGYGGTWAQWHEVADEQVSEGSMARTGHPLGPGIVAPLWSGGCGLAATAAIADYLARSSAGQCGPCVFGLAAIADSLARLARGTARATDVDRLRDDSAAVAGRGACHHPDGAVRLVRSALQVFADDVDLHASGRRCGRPIDRLIPVPEART